MVIWIVIMLAFWLMLYAMAKSDFVVGFCPSGHIKTAMNGESLCRFIVNVPGYRLGQSGPQAGRLVKDPTVRPSWLGIYWIGIPPFRQILRYPYSWRKWAAPKARAGVPVTARETVTYQIVARNELVDSLVFRYPYPVLVTNAKLKGNIDVRVTLLVTVEIVHPETTLFKITPSGTWINLVIAKVEEAVRGWSGSKSVDDLRQLKDQATPDDFRNAILVVNKGKDGILALCGVKIISTEFQYFQFESPEVEKAFQAPVLAIQAKEVTITKAEATAEEITLVGTARGEALEAVNKTPGGVEADKSVRMVEALPRNLQYLGGAVTPILPALAPTPGITSNQGNP